MMKFSAAVLLIFTALIEHFHSLEIDFNSKALIQSQIDTLNLGIYLLKNREWLGVAFPLKALPNDIETNDYQEMTLESIVHPIRLKFPPPNSDLPPLMSVSIFDVVERTWRCSKWHSKLISNERLISEITQHEKGKIVDWAGNLKGFFDPESFSFGVLHFDINTELYISARTHKLTILISSNKARSTNLNQYCYNEIWTALTNLKLGLDVPVVVNLLIPAITGSPFLRNINYALLGLEEYQ